MLNESSFCRSKNFFLFPFPVSLTFDSNPVYFSLFLPSVFFSRDSSKTLLAPVNQHSSCGFPRLQSPAFPPVQRHKYSTPAIQRSATTQHSNPRTLLLFLSPVPDLPANLPSQVFRDYYFIFVFPCTVIIIIIVIIKSPSRALFPHCALLFAWVCPRVRPRTVRYNTDIDCHRYAL